jgi:hypothetical protein
MFYYILPVYTIVSWRVGVFPCNYVLLRVLRGMCMLHMYMSYVRWRVGVWGEFLEDSLGLVRLRSGATLGDELRRSPEGVSLKLQGV